MLRFKIEKKIVNKKAFFAYFCWICFFNSVSLVSFAFKRKQRHYLNWKLYGDILWRFYYTHQNHTQAQNRKKIDALYFYHCFDAYISNFYIFVMWNLSQRVFDNGKKGNVVCHCFNAFRFRISSIVHHIKGMLKTYAFIIKRNDRMCNNVIWKYCNHEFSPVRRTQFFNGNWECTALEYKTALAVLGFTKEFFNQTFATEIIYFFLTIFA